MYTAPSLLAHTYLKDDVETFRDQEICNKPSDASPEAVPCAANSGTCGIQFPAYERGWMTVI